jgi:DNA-binding CsgD family transcriptional regulator
MPFDPRSLAASPAGTISGLDDRALLVTFTPQQAVVGPVLTAMQQFGLTLAEAEVALALSLGLTPQEIADQRVASIHTVRNQIKAILAKTHSRRQADIARLVVRLRH